MTCPDFAMVSNQPAIRSQSVMQTARCRIYNLWEGRAASDQTVCLILYT